ncbi:hypothetical protein V1506DRAFT_516877 [Lipomyces tetrasporus]
MATTDRGSNRENLLTVSLSRFLTGDSVDEVLAKDWEKDPEAAKRFNNIGFDLDGNDILTTFLLH